MGCFSSKKERPSPQEEAGPEQPRLSKTDREAFLRKVKEFEFGAKRDGTYFEFFDEWDFSTKLGKAVRADRECMLSIIKKDGWAFGEASDKLKSDKELALLAVQKTGILLEHASNNLKSDKEVVLAAIGQNSNAVMYASDNLKNDKNVMFAALQDLGVAKEMSVKDMMLTAVRADGFNLRFAPNHLKNDKDVVLAAFREIGIAVDDQMSVRDVALAAANTNSSYGSTLGLLADNFKSDKEVVLASVKTSGRVCEAVNKTAAMWADKDFVLQVVQVDGPSLKYAQGGLNQDHECLKASGLWDSEADKTYKRSEQAILSVKFSLAEGSTQYASDFALAMKKDPFLKEFKTYNPNAFCKKSCDKKFTDINHPCRGTLSTCTIPASENLQPVTKRPCATSCWRFAFRFHQDECKETGGFMIQVEERDGLGNGQKIETEMAKQAKLKVFRAYTNLVWLYERENGYHADAIEILSEAVQEWYRNKCTNMDVENIFIGLDSFPDGDSAPLYTKKPRYEKSDAPQ